MSFHLKRYGRALRTYRRWAWLALLPLVLYLGFAAIDDIAYSVSQDFSDYSADLPIAAANSPIATLKLERVVAEPDLLFIDGFALAQLQKRLQRLNHHRQAADEDALRDLARFAMTLSETPGSGLRISYTGDDATLGRAVVAFYTERLRKRISEGAARIKSGVAAAPPTFQPTGALVVVGERSLWRADRLLPATMTLLLSALGVLVLIAVFELTDQSFKSERQMARYLKVPVLGAIPDTEPLLRTLPE